MHAHNCASAHAHRIVYRRLFYYSIKGFVIACVVIYKVPVSLFQVKIAFGEEEQANDSLMRNERFPIGMLRTSITISRWPYLDGHISVILRSPWAQTCLE